MKKLLIIFIFFVSSILIGCVPDNRGSARQGTYALYERNYPKWYEVWIPYGEVVKK